MLKGTYVNDHRDRRLFKPGHRVSWAAVLDPLKRTEPGTGVTHSNIMLEMAVSLKPEA